MTTGTWVESSTSSWKLPSVTSTRSGWPGRSVSPASGAPAPGPAGGAADGAGGRCFSEDRSTAPRGLSGVAAAGGPGREAGEVVAPLYPLRRRPVPPGRAGLLEACPGQARGGGHELHRSGGTRRRNVDGHGLGEVEHHAG